jgi:hypothetical protein
MPAFVKFWILEMEDFNGSMAAGFKGAKGPLLMTVGFGKCLVDCRLFWNHICDKYVRGRWMSMCDKGW